MFLFWSRGLDGYRKNDRKRAVVWPWLVLELSSVLALTQLGIRQSDWWRAGIRSTNLHIVVEYIGLNPKGQTRVHACHKKYVLSCWRKFPQTGMMWLNSYSKIKIAPLLLADILTHWGQDKMVDIFQTRFSNAFFFNENIWISIPYSLKFVPKGPINKIPALVQIMAWHGPGDKPSSESLMVRLSTHICGTLPQWVNAVCVSISILGFSYLSPVMYQYDVGVLVYRWVSARKT